jgi:hypothetical protein
MIADIRYAIKGCACRTGPKSNIKDRISAIGYKKISDKLLLIYDIRYKDAPVERDQNQISKIGYRRSDIKKYPTNDC